MRARARALPAVLVVLLAALLLWQLAILGRYLGWSGRGVSRTYADADLDGENLQFFDQSRIEILRRTKWRAAKPKLATAPLGRPWRITLHHRGGPPFRADDRAGSARAIRAIQNDHQGRRGWADIGYHFVVDRAGRLWEARSLTSKGAHAGRGANAGNLGILVLGNFDEQSLTRQQESAVRKLVRSIREHWEIPADRVFTHDEVRRAAGHHGTACPGKGLRALVTALRDDPRPVARSDQG